MNTKEEEKNRGFSCINCRKWIPVSPYTNTLNRNHCPYCLWSKHVDRSIAGDRLASCNSGMKPIGLSIKKPRMDKWEKEVKGELMIIHECVKCGKISINRVLSEDSKEKIMEVFQLGIEMDDKKRNKIEKDGVRVLVRDDRGEVETQLFGKR